MISALLAFLLLLQPATQPTAEEVFWDPETYVPPADWPITWNQYRWLTKRNLHKSFDAEKLKQAGLKSGLVMRDFAVHLLEIDFAPLTRDFGLPAWAAYREAYELLGLHGSLEDLQELFTRVKALEARHYTEESSLLIDIKEEMITALGYFLLRDHFHPIKDRALMEEIEDYLYRCSDWDGASCWKNLSPTKLKLPFRSAADDALAISLSARGMAHYQEWVKAKDYNRRINAKVSLELIESLQKDEKFLRENLRPVLPYNELYQEKGDSLPERNPLPNLLERKFPM